MIPFIEMIVPVGRRRPGKPLEAAKGVVIHNTDNKDPGADALANAKWQQNTPDYETPKGSTSSWHITAGETNAIISIPLDEIAYHCGNSKGNKTTVGIEIPMNSDGDLLKATDNAAVVAAWVLRKQGFTKAVHKENIWQHYDWSGKNCPSMLRQGKPYDWETFVKKVNVAMEEMAKQPEPKPVTPTVPTGKSAITLNRLLYYREGKITCRGEDVTNLQRLLNSKGIATGKVDGVFGKLTRAGVVAFQEIKHLSKDGVVGPKTTAALGGTWSK